jgi:archaellum component FlaG (FlaF/FlaG flagellin family)
VIRNNTGKERDILVGVEVKIIIDGEVTEKEKKQLEQVARFATDMAKRIIMKEDLTEELSRLSRR